MTSTTVPAMEGFRTAYAAGDDWAHVASECARALGEFDDAGDGRARLGFLYLTDTLAGDAASVLAYLRQKTGVEHWVGTVGLGVLGDAAEYYDEGAAAAMVGTFPAGGFRVFPPLRDGPGDMEAGLRHWIETVSPSFGVVHGDPANPATPTLIEELSLLDSGPLGGRFLVGGLTAARGAGCQIADQVVEGGVSGVLFGPGVEVATGLTQGCTPLGEARLVTDAIDNVIVSIDGRPALDVLKGDVGELLARDLRRIAGYVHAAFPVPGSDTRDYMVRNLVAVDAERGWVGVGGPVETGDRVLFVRRDPDSARQDLADMLDGLKKRLPGPPAGALYCSCVARGPNMFGATGNEVALLRAALGDVPLVGFFGGGEISASRLYTYTGVLTLFF